MQRSYDHLIRVALTVVALCLTLGAGAAQAASAAGKASATGQASGYVPHEVLVGYQPGPIAASTATMAMRMGARQTGAPAPNSHLLRLPRGESVAAAIQRLRQQPGVAYAEPNYIARDAGDWYPNDPGRAHRPGGWEQTQWNLMPGTGVNAPEAWANLLAAHRAGGRGVVVAVLDTGIAYRKWKKFRKSPDFTWTHFVHPYDFVAHNRYPLDRNGHGTFVAGVIAESTNNHYGLTGLAYNASIMPVRILNSGGLGNESTIAAGIRYAVKHGAQIINLSLEFLPNQVTSASEIPLIVSAINYAHSRGVTVVGAAGNDMTDEIAYPARAHNVISVGATTKDRCLADYSNGGDGLDLVAPGGGSDASIASDSDCHPDQTLPAIYQLTLTDPPHWGRFGYPGYYVGTSMSAPEVSAAAALVIASGVIGHRPSPDAILARLEQTADPLGATTPSIQFGYGLLDVGAATTPGPAQAPPPA